MKKSFYLILFILAFTSYNTYAQVKIHELGFRSSNLKEFSFIYSKGSEEKAVRYRAGYGNASYIDRDTYSAINANFNLAVGFVKRRNIHNKLSFYHGFEPSLGFSYVKQSTNNPITILTPSLGYILGFQYDISDNFIFSAETIPSVNSTVMLGDYVDTNINASINMNTVYFGITYRYEK